MYTKEQFTKDWKHFCNHINFGASNLDADSIRFMNEGPGKILQTIKTNDALLEACKMVNNSIFQDRDGEWQLSRPAELLKTIVEEAISLAEKQ